MSLKARETVEEYAMLPEGASVVAALSGGADSTALLYFLCSLREEKKLKVAAAHLNHGLRGAEALRDERACAALCKRLGVPFYLKRADVAAEAKARGESIEQAGRRVRYAFLEETAAELGARLATAHTLGDSVETMFINLLRGTGLRGLCGIPPVRGNIIRPLLFDTRADIEAYCAAHGLSFVTDSTNAARAFTRNRVRLDAIPVFTGLNPAFFNMAARAMKNLAADEEYLSKGAARALDAAARGENIYSLDAFAKMEPPLFARAAAEAVFRGTGREPEEKHIRLLRSLAENGGGAVGLPGGFRAEARKGNLVFRGAAFAEKPAPPPAVPLAPGVFERGGFRVTAEKIGPETDEKYLKIIHKQYFNSLVDCAKMKGNPVLRTRRPGDRLRPCGRGVTKTLKKWMNEEAVPVRLRDLMPVAADEEGILWAAGFGADERCAAGPETEQTLKITAEYTGGNEYAE